MSVNSPDTPPTAPSGALTRALYKVLQPLVRLMLAHGLTYPAVAEMLKRVFIEVAMRDFQLADKGQTDSRLSLLTGIHRKDVKRLRGLDAARDRIPATVSLGSQVIAVWITDPQYVDADGAPQPLQRLASRGGNGSFETLAQSVSKDVRPRALLDELLRVGAVTLDEDDRVRLNNDAFIPRAGLDERAYYFGRALSDHLAAGVHNLLDGTPPYLERIVHYDRLPPEAIEELRSLAEKQGMQSLKAVNRQAMRHAMNGAGRTNARRFTFGVYFYAEDAGSQPEAGNADDAQ